MLVGRTSINLQKCKIVFFTFPSCEKCFRLFLKHFCCRLFGPIEKSLLFGGINFMLKLRRLVRLWPPMTLPVWEGSICIQNIPAILFKSGVETELPHPSLCAVSHYWPGEPPSLVATWHSGQLFVSTQLNRRIFSSLLRLGSRLLNKLRAGCRAPFNSGVEWRSGFWETKRIINRALLHLSQFFFFCPRQTSQPTGEIDHPISDARHGSECPVDSFFGGVFEGLSWVWLLLSTPRS